mmetsp:Transcript_24341/g.28020  ORF Transcript_24341/g.28020 Transcript_24341/m.28020 type:complete len:123 (-) Transcript_24341:48-416(-)
MPSLSMQNNELNKLQEEIERVEQEIQDAKDEIEEKNKYIEIHNAQLSRKRQTNVVQNKHETIDTIDEEEEDNHLNQSQRGSQNKRMALKNVCNDGYRNTLMRESMLSTSSKNKKSHRVKQEC